MMVFSNLLKPSNDFSRARASSSTSARSAKGPIATSPTSSRKGSTVASDDHPYIASEDQISDVADAESPDLLELNDCLGALAQIFPDVQVEVFREMLMTLGEESRLAVVTEALIKDKKKWAEGRLKVARKDSNAQQMEEIMRPGPEGVGVVPKEETFRNDAYKLAVKNAAYSEFKGLSHSTVKAVLAEHNHSFTRARPTLAALNARSWRFSIASIFTRRKANADHNPWVVWHSTGQGSIYPTLKATGCAELDKELYEALLKPLQSKNKNEQLEKDWTFALELNTQEATEAESLHDCECCYGSTTFEELAACTTGDHVVCFQCIKHCVSEAVYGQGWARNIDAATGTLRCIAPMSTECHGCIPQELIKRALEHHEGGDDILRKLDERLIENNLLKAQLPLVRCPFCNYAEIDQIYLPPGHQKWRFRRHTPLSMVKILAVATFISMIPRLIPLIVLIAFTFLLSCSNPQIYNFAKQQVAASITRMKRRQHGLRFLCQSPTCSRASCINCSKAWTDIHICHESSLLALRTEVETAMSLAIKRTCPRCNTSFVKSSGCNKLTCVCGYQMCYVCRKDIGQAGEGYRHFCEHFRPNGGRGCTECEKCDLYRIEDDEAVVLKAKEEAEVKWMQDQNGEGDEKLKKELVDRYDESHRGRIVGLWKKRPSPEQILDAAVEFVIE